MEAEEAYDQMLSKLGSSSSRRGRSMLQLQRGASGGSGDGGAGSRASPAPAAGSRPRTPIRSSSLVLAAQQLEALQRQEEGGGGGGPQPRPQSPDQVPGLRRPLAYNGAQQQLQPQQQQPQRVLPSPFDVEQLQGAPRRQVASLPVAPSPASPPERNPLRQAASASAAGLAGRDPSSFFSGLVDDLEEPQ